MHLCVRKSCTDTPISTSSLLNPRMGVCNYLADFPHFREAEAASCEGLVMECKVHNVLKQVGLNKSPGLDDLPYEV